MSPIRRLSAGIAEGLPRIYWFLWGGTLVNRLGTFVMPMLTFYLTQERKLSLEDAGLVVSSYGAGSLIGVSLGGELADRIGRRRTLIFSLVAGSTAMLLLGQMRALWAIALFGFLLGAFGDLYRPASQALIADVVAPEKRMKAFGLLYWAINLGFAGGTSLAGYLAKSGFQILFVGDALTTLIYAWIIWRFIAETRPTGHEDKPGGFLTPFTDRVFAPHLVLSFLLVLVFFQHLVALPAQMIANGLDSADYGRAIALNGVLIVLVQPFTTRWFAQVPRSWTLFIAGTLVGIGMWIHGQSSTLPGHLLAVAVWTMGEILMAPVNASIVADLSPAHLRGRYQGAFSLTWSGATMVGPVLGPLLIRAGSMKTLWLVCLGLGVATALGQLVLGPVRKKALGAD
jgi:MFS family permease